MRTVNFNIFRLSSYTLSPGMLLLLGTPTEPYFHDTPSTMMSHFPEPFRFPENFIPSKWILILEKAKCKWGNKSDEYGGFPVQHQIFFAMHLNRECFVNWGIVVMDEEVTGPEIKPCSTHRFM
jgi:hypothetical protein